MKLSASSSLSTKIIAPIALISMISIILLIVFFNINANKLTGRFLENRAFELAELLTIKIETNTSKSNLNRVVSAIGSYKDVNNIILINKNTEEIIASNRNSLINKHYSNIRQESTLTALRNQINNNVINHNIFSDNKNEEITLIYPFRAVSPDKKRIIPTILVISISGENLTDSLNLFLRPSLYIQTIILLILPLISIYLIRNVILNPTKKLIKAIKNSSENKQLTVDTINSNDEIGYLVESYNDLSNKTKDYQKNLLIEKEKSEASAKAKSEFLAIMTHELRTPLNAVIGMSDLLRNLNIDGKEGGYIKTINQSGKQLLSVINDILDFSKIESGKLELNPVNFNILKLIENVMTIMKFQAQEKDINITHSESFSDESVNLFGDDIRINQILINLIGNAIKFTEDGYISVITRETMTEENIVSFEIKIIDSGIGMSEKQLTGIFNRFTQADSSTTRKFGGTGLGLSISKLLCEKMNGELLVNSKENIGTCFTLKLKLPKGLISDINSDQENKVWKDSYFISNEIRPNILVVDDTPMNLVLAESILVDQNFNVMTAVNGLEALKKMTEQDIHIVLMDCLMPEMDGFEATKKLRDHEKIEKRTHLPVIALTASALNETKDKCMQAGMDDFLTKPLDSQTLIKKIQFWLMKSYP